MELTGIGGGIMLAIAAALWLVYLVPNWLRRREYLATERNAVRLQQTIRVLAETAEVPAAVRVEREAQLRAESARRVELELRHQRPVAVGRPAAYRAPDARAGAARRLRRTRALTSLVLLAALVVGIVQLSLVVSAGAVAGSWLVLGGASLVTLCSFAVLSRSAEVARARRSTEVARPERRTSLGAQEPRVREEPVSWTPVPVPKPLYLSRAVAQTQAATDPAFELELAAAFADRALRAVEREVAPIRPAATAPAASRFARMGIVDDTSGAAPDIDAALARRRAAG